MTASRPDNEAIFHAARDIPDPDAPAAYVREACGGDAARIADVEALLAAARRHRQPARTVRRPARPPMRRIDAADRRGPRHGDRPVQAARADRRGGHGQRLRWPSRPSRSSALVALKLIKAGMDYPAGHRPLRGRAAGPGPDGPPQHRPGARRRHDRAWPAVLRHGAGQGRADHPTTATSTSSRRRGSGWNCSSRSARRCSTRTRRAIIHRDLKPSNVLVALYDGKPVPKVIDFGVAKATGQQLTDKTLFTGFGAIVGTLEYMSPEQAELNELDIDTRSDIYSLGVLLYELLDRQHAVRRKELTPGRHAGDAAGDPRGGAAEAEHAAEHGGAACRRLAANRGTEPAKLTRLVRGRARLDRDEGAGEGPQPALRDGQRLRDGPAALPGRRAGAGRARRRRGIASGSSPGAIGRQ